MIKVAKDKLVNLLNQFGDVVVVSNDKLEFTREDKFSLISLTFMQDVWNGKDVELHVKLYTVSSVKEGYRDLCDEVYISRPITDAGLLDIVKEVITVFDNCDLIQ